MLSTESNALFLPTADSTYDAAADKVTLTMSGDSPAIQGIFGDLVPSKCSVSQVVGPTGGRLALEGAGAAISVPEGTVTRTIKDNITISLVKEDRLRPKIPEGKIL